ncbi:infection structure specific protein [Rhypophila decipiens]|uniref:Infection structure specific protein n=1 Tax=Rhypophila decipiens TaxID=261697 RepID=A0AAN7B718_9PEZI|nr:infection structure specific protein [Rhypophila decipiens]
MLTRSVLLAAAATAVSAELFPGHQQVKRALEARQTAGGDVSMPAGAIPTCIQPLFSLYSSLPTPPPEIVHLSITGNDPCAPFTPPPSAAAPYSSYSSEVVSWFGEHSSEIMSAISSCPQVTALPGAGDAISSLEGSICTSTPAAGGGDDDSSSTGTESSGPEETGTDSMDHGTMSHGATDAPTPTGTAGGGAAGTTSKSTAGAFAARETGFAGAAMAAAGFFGVVAML